MTDTAFAGWPDEPPMDQEPPLPPFPDELDDAYEARVDFHREVEKEAGRIRVREAARDRVRAETAGETLIPDLVRLDEFLARPLDPITHRIAGLWPIGGRVLLAAQWKAGKTTLRDNVIRALVDNHTATMRDLLTLCYAVTPSQ